MKKNNSVKALLLSVLLIFGLLLIIPSCEVEASWTSDHYGILTIKNQSSYPITEIKILEYSDESGLKTVDTTQLLSNSSRTYQNVDGVKLEYTTFAWYGNFKTRHIKVRYNDEQKSKTIWLSEGYDVEVVVDDSGLSVTNPIYDPSAGQQ
jgi:hypothetical protein